MDDATILFGIVTLLVGMLLAMSVNYLINLKADLSQIKTDISYIKNYYSKLDEKKDK
jgi:hypothetical protein